MDVLANWVWQGCAVALAATVILHAFPRTSATTRHRGWWIALALVVALPWLPALLALRSWEPVTIAPDRSTPLSVTVSLPPLPWWPAVLMLTAWIVWVAGSLYRLGGALVALRRAKSIATPLPAEREARLRGWLSVRATGRHATLVVSEEVRSAGVLGLRAPVIAVAPVVLRDLSDSELDQILVHEWAHVQRRDDIGRLCQVLVTAVAGLHPAIWWINRRLHVEREAACDDWTINVTGASTGYAACLTKLAAMGNDGSLVPAAWSSSSLRTRVVGLLDRSRNRSTRFTVASLAIAPVLGAIALTAASVELVVFRPITLASFDLVVSGVHAAVPTVAAPRPVAEPRPVRDPEVGTRVRGAAVTSAPTSPPARPDTIHADRAEQDSAASSFPVLGARASDGDRSLPSVAASPREITYLPGTSEPVATPLASASVTAATGRTPTPWGAAADVGVAIGDAGVAIGDAGAAVGRGSKKGAVATAGFFTRAGKSIARSF